METVVVTGANIGIGYEACKQLTLEESVKKVILACRNQEKAEAAVAKLVEETLKPKETFEILILDTSNLESCREAANELSNVSGVVLNAGGLIAGEDKAGFPLMHKANTIGHVVFLEALLDNGKVAPGFRAIYAGSESARGIDSIGMKLPVYTEPYEECIVQHLKGKVEGQEDLAYAFTKGIGALYIASLARKRPDYYFACVSPGMTSGTGIMENQNIIMKYITIYIAMPFLAWRGSAHAPDQAAKRYVDVLMSRNDSPSGVFLASAKDKIAGPLEDQGPIWEQFNIEDLQEAAYKAVHTVISHLE